MSKNSLILSLHDAGATGEPPISRRNLLARGGALGAASTLGIGLGTALMPTASHAYTIPGNITVKAGGIASQISVSGRVYMAGVERFFSHIKTNDGQSILIIGRYVSIGSSNYYYEGAVYGGINNLLYYNKCVKTALSNELFQWDLSNGVTAIPRSSLGPNIDGGRNLAVVDWQYPAGAQVTDTGSIAEFSEADTVFYSKFFEREEPNTINYSICLTICYLNPWGQRVWSNILTVSAATHKATFNDLTRKLSILKNAAKSFSDAKGLRNTAYIVSGVAAVGALAGAVFSCGVGAGTAATAIILAAGVVNAANIFTSNSAIELTTAGTEFNNAFEIACSCGPITR